MKAAVCRSFGDPLSIEDVTLRAPGAQDVMIAVRACSICHSDVAFADGAWGGALPAIFGHEVSGVVEAVGSDVEQFKPGDRVIGTLIRSCGSCPSCDRGIDVTCEGVISKTVETPVQDQAGLDVRQPMKIGGFAEATVVHQSQVVSIPNDIAFEQASLLACGVLTGYCAVTKTARVPAGAHVVIIGAGGVGLNSIQGAKSVDAASVIAIDVYDAKLKSAERFGATHTLNGMTDDIAGEISKITKGRGVDFVFVTVGARSAMEQAFGLLAPMGAVVLVGMPATGVLSSFDPGRLAGLNQSILGSKMGTARVAIDVPYLAKSYLDGRLILDELLSERYTLYEINDAMQSSRTGAALRNVIVFP